MTDSGQILARFETISKLLHETRHIGEAKAHSEDIMAYIKRTSPSEDRLSEAAGACAGLLSLIQEKAKPLMTQPFATVGPLLEELANRSIRPYGELMAIEATRGA
jgi:hypothetical protein